MWGQPGPGTQPFPKPSRGVLRCLTSELVRGLPGACIQKQGCAEREKQLFIVGIQCYMDPARHLIPYHINSFPSSSLLYSSRLPCWHNSLQPAAYLLTWCSCRYLASKFTLFSSTEKLHEGFPSLPALLRTRGLCYSKDNCKAFFKRMFR